MKVRMFKKGADGSRDYDTVGFYGGTYHILTETEVDDCLNQTSQMLNSTFETFSTNGSGWILERVEKITLKVAKKSLDKKGGSYIPTPKSIRTKHAVINVQNKDLKCFEYSILAALHHKQLLKPERVSSYKKWINTEFDMTEFPQPMHPKMIHKFEEKYNLSINVYHIESEGNLVTPFLISKKRANNPINLLLIEDSKAKSHHYVYIKSFSRLMIHGSKEKGSKYCPYCLHRFSRFKSTSKFEDHKENCGSYEPARVIMPNEQEKWIKFKNFKYLDKHPVVIYADFESYNVPIKDESYNSEILTNNKKSYTRKITKQDCSGYSFTIVSPYYNGKKIFTYRGKNAVLHFLNSLEREEKKIRNWFYKNEFKYPELNIKEKLDFHESKDCYLCEEEMFTREHIDKFLPPIIEDLKKCGLPHKFPTTLEINKKRKCIKIRRKNENISVETLEELKNNLESLKRIEDYLKNLHPALLKGPKVADHDHFDGTFRGAAHNVCNLNRRKFSKIPCFFHNFTGYDCHLIVKQLAGHDYKPKVIAKTMEKYIYLGLNRIDFKDSLQFLPNTLEQLTKNLREKDGKNFEKFPNLWSYFKEKWGHLHESNFDLITRKLHYPYSYISNEAIFLEQNPPDISKFKSDLTNEDLTAEEYESFLYLWNSFGLKNIGELHDLYVEVDVLLLADCFEKFRTFSLKNYRLDPVHFMTAPGLSWDSALLHTGVILEIPTDPDIHLFIDKGIRGGISFVGNPHAKALNKYINKETNEIDEEDYIMFFDVNNQYGAAMSDYLPTDGFEWDSSFDNMSLEEQNEFILALKDDDPTGYIFSVDLEYPHNIHDLHDEFPLCPENLTIKDEWLSKYQIDMKEKFEIKGLSKKLCLTLFDKKDYIIHYRNLKYCLSKGLKIKKVKKVLKFNQSPWLRSYIELNTKLRQEADSKFEESFPKLMNNSFFGKTCQNKRKYTNIKIATNRSEAEHFIASPRMMKWKIIDEELGMFDMGQYSIKLDKPRYIGFCVLELSKLIMYKFHYDYILPQFPKTKLLFTDTDSFCYHIKTKQDVYEVIRGNSTWFDFSNYPPNHANFDNKINHLKPGVFKDETGSIPIQKFIGLRSKMYSVQCTNEQNGKRTAKGILRSQQKRMNHDDYYNSLFQKETTSFIGTKIMQKEHALYTAEIRKKGLCPYNDKKYIERDKNMFETKSFGHYTLN